MKAAIVYLVEPSRVEGMYGKKAAVSTSLTSCRKSQSCLLNSLSTLANNNPALVTRYPVELLHEPSFPQRARTIVQFHAHKMKLTLRFRTIVLNNSQGNEEFTTSCARYWGTHRAFRSTSTRSGYFGMCAFFAFDFPRVLADYDYVMRIDTDSCVGAFGYDPFRRANSSGYDYMYRSLFREHGLCMQGWNQLLARRLCANTSESQHALHRIQRWMRLEVCAHRSALRGFFQLTKPTVRVIDNNFEIMRTASFRTPAVMSFLNAVQQAGGIRRSRWGDALIRTFTLLLFIPEERIYRTSSWDYTHKGRPRLKRRDALGLSAPVIKFMVMEQSHA